LRPIFPEIAICERMKNWEGSLLRLLSEVTPGRKKRIRKAMGTYYFGEDLFREESQENGTLFVEKKKKRIWTPDDVRGGRNTGVKKRKITSLWETNLLPAGNNATRTKRRV